MQTATHRQRRCDACDRHRARPPRRSIVSGRAADLDRHQADLAITGTGNALSALGLTGKPAPAPLHRGSHRRAGGISGKTLTFTSFNGGTAVNVTFGDGIGQVKTLNQLNAALPANNLQATIDADRHLNIVTSND